MDIHCHATAWPVLWPGLHYKLHGDVVLGLGSSLWVKGAAIMVHRSEPFMNHFGDAYGYQTCPTIIGRAFFCGPVSEVWEIGRGDVLESIFNDLQ